MKGISKTYAVEVEVDGAAWRCKADDEGPSVMVFFDIAFKRSERSLGSLFSERFLLGCLTGRNWQSERKSKNRLCNQAAFELRSPSATC